MSALNDLMSSDYMSLVRNEKKLIEYYRKLRAGGIKPKKAKDDEEGLSGKAVIDLLGLSKPDVPQGFKRRF